MRCPAHVHIMLGFGGNPLFGRSLKAIADLDNPPPPLGEGVATLKYIKKEPGNSTDKSSSNEAFHTRGAVAEDFWED